MVRLMAATRGEEHCSSGKGFPQIGGSSNSSSSGNSIILQSHVEHGQVNSLNIAHRVIWNVR